jgi:hypothetical protein
MCVFIGINMSLHLRHSRERIRDARFAARVAATIAIKSACDAAIASALALAVRSNSSNAYNHINHIHIYHTHILTVHIGSLETLKKEKEKIKTSTAVSAPYKAR